MDQRKTMHNILTQREDFLVIGLTGRLGSGCSKVAEVLATPFEEMNFPNPVPQLGLPSLTPESRTIRILAEYAQAHWLKFDVIQVGAIIANFILDDDTRFVYDLNRNATQAEADELQNTFHEMIFEDFYWKLVQLGQTLGVVPRNEIKEYYMRRIADDEEQKKTVQEGKLVRVSGQLFVRNILVEEYKAALRGDLARLIGDMKKLVSEEKLLAEYFSDEKNTALEEAVINATVKSGQEWEKIGEAMDRLYREVLQKDPTIHRRKYLECADGVLALISFHCLVLQLNDFLEAGMDAANALWMWLKRVNDCVAPNPKEDQEVFQIHQYVFVKYLTPWFGKTVRKTAKCFLGEDAYTRLFQRYGQMIRFYSHIPPYEGTDNFAGKRDIFAIPRKINQHIKVLRHPFHKKYHRPVRVVVDSIKNIFEAVYLRYRYSAFYLWAITTDAEIRERRLHEKHLTDTQIRQLEWNEYPDKGSEIIKRIFAALDKNEFDPADSSRWKEICNLSCEPRIREEEVDFYFDWLPNKQSDKHKGHSDEFDEIRRKFFRNGTYVFYAQDVDSCVCNADVYLFNNVAGFGDAENHFRLLEAVVRNVSLAMYPGLVRPTSVERCMQIALGAKVNSGCLSRQVGAVVTDSQYNILAIGWNDVPCGEVPCAYKNMQDIVAGADPDAYSEYELTNPDFRERIKKYNTERPFLGGLPCSYCFKDVHQDGRDPMRSRAMHAEEKALALCGREAEGGFLFTTSSPCEMCSKNAKNHKIKKINYIEAYPGISQAQYTNSGERSNRAELILFSGAVGRAYVQMYTPLLPHKDVLEYLGVHKNRK